MDAAGPKPAALVAASGMPSATSATLSQIASSSDQISPAPKR